MNYHKNATKVFQKNENFLRNLENLKIEIDNKSEENFDFSPFAPLQK